MYGIALSRLRFVKFRYNTVKFILNRVINLLNKSWAKLNSQSLIRDIITTTGWGVIGKAFGFLIPFFIAAWFGVSGETDAFFFVYGLILFISGIFAPVVETIIVPYIAEARKKGDDVGIFVGKIFSFSTVGLVILLIVLLFLIKPVLTLITRFDSQTLGMIYNLIFETIPLVILIVWSSILGGILNAYKKFIFPVVSPAFRAIINLSIIFLFKDKLGVHAIALGYVIGEIGRLAILAGVIKKLKLFKLILSFSPDPKIMEFLKTSSYQVIGLVAIGINPIVDKAMGSWLGEGSVSILYYADRLYIIPVSFMIIGLFPVVLSHWSDDYYQGKSGVRLFQRAKTAARLVLGISIIVVVILFILRKLLIRLAFGRGEFDPLYLQAIQWPFVFYLFGLIPYVVGSMFTRAHLVLKNTPLLMRLCFLNVVLNIVLNYVLMRRLGIAGIALSTTITVTIITVLLFYYLGKKIREGNNSV